MVAGKQQPVALVKKGTGITPLRGCPFYDSGEFGTTGKC
jgi:hypothetical protein